MPAGCFYILLSNNSLIHYHSSNMKRIIFILALMLIAAIQPACAQSSAAQREQLLNLLNEDLPEKVDDNATILKVETVQNGELCFVIVINDPLMQQLSDWNTAAVDTFKKEFLADFIVDENMKSVVHAFGKNLHVKLINKDNKPLASISVKV